jgi:hypothetical protein
LEDRQFPTNERVRPECTNPPCPSGWIVPALDLGSGCSRFATVQLVDDIDLRGQHLRSAVIHKCGYRFLRFLREAIRHGVRLMSEKWVVGQDLRISVGFLGALGGSAAIVTYANCNAGRLSHSVRVHTCRRARRGPGRRRREAEKTRGEKTCIAAR